MKKVTNINTSGSHYLVHVCLNNLEIKEVHCYSKEQLDKKVTELCEDKTVHDFAVYLKVDFDIEEVKESFYKNENEHYIKWAVDKLYNDYVGGEENHWLDTGERCYGFTEDSLIKTITDEILKTKSVLWLENGLGVEAKHIRFVGKKRVAEIVEHRVKHRRNKEGWIFEGGNK